MATRRKNVCAARVSLVDLGLMWSAIVAMIVPAMRPMSPPLSLSGHGRVTGIVKIPAGDIF
ncbi:MAG: hypothetical protein NQU46_08490 [Methanolinea sp.]|nr:hypothetical protein [Methanolinea sp.]